MAGKLKQMYDMIQNPKDVDIEAMAQEIAIKLEFYIKSGDKLPIEMILPNHIVRVENVLNKIMSLLKTDYGVICRADHMETGKAPKLVVTEFV